MAIGRPILDIVFRYLVASDIYAVVGWYPIAIGFANQPIPWALFFLQPSYIFKFTTIRLGELRIENHLIQFHRMQLTNNNTYLVLALNSIFHDKDLNDNCSG